MEKMEAMHQNICLVWRTLYADLLFEWLWGHSLAPLVNQ